MAVLNLFFSIKALNRLELWSTGQIYMQFNLVNNKMTQGLGKWCFWFCFDVANGSGRGLQCASVHLHVCTLALMEAFRVFKHSWAHCSLLFISPYASAFVACPQNNIG